MKDNTNEPLQLTDREKRLLFTPAPRAEKPAKQAALELARLCLENRVSDTAYRIRGLLLSLYDGASNPCNLADIHYMDRDVRALFCSILTEIGVYFWDYEIREAFRKIGGRSGVRWLYEGSPDFQESWMEGERE